MINTSICLLCCKKSQLQKSHAIPNAFFKEILRSNSGQSIIIPDNAHDPIHQSHDSWDTPQLCADCEKLLNQEYERYSINVLKMQNISYKKHDRGVTFFQIDSPKLINFFIAVFWRSANSKHNLYSKVFISQPQNEQIRRMLLAVQTIPETFITIRLSLLADNTPNNGFSSDDLKQVIISPFCRNHNTGHPSFCFVFVGFFVEIFPSALKFTARKKHGVIKEKSDKILVPYIDIFKIPEIKECLVRGYQKHQSNHTSL